MIFKNIKDLEEKFPYLPKDVPIKWIRHNGSITKYISDTYLDRLALDIFLRQDGIIKKYNYSQTQNLEIKFANEDDRNSIED